jgi:hypothetical protein
MYRVRHYDLLIHPARFKGAGWRGVAVRALNWVRWKLEVLVQRFVVSVLASRGGFSSEEKQGVLRAFHADVRLEQLEKERAEVEAPPQVTERADRYLSTFRSELEKEASEDTTPQRPVPLDDLASRYAQAPRARRYARGRRYTVTNDSDDFEPLAKGSDQHVE